MTKILLCRHGHVEGIHPARFRGRAELALTERGLAEADALAKRIAANWKPAAVFTSPLQRCVLTGARIAAFDMVPRARRGWMPGSMDYDSRLGSPSKCGEARVCGRPFRPERKAS